LAKKKKTKENLNPLSKESKKQFKPVYQIVIVILLIGAFIFLVFPDLFKKSTKEFYMFKKEGELTFFTDNNEKIVTIDIEIADTDYDRQLGLMKRNEMREREGMLFIFPDNDIKSFWMRNTLIPLDMLFVNSEKKIVTIHKNTKPLSDQSYHSTAPAVYVVEVNAGFADKYNIKEGDRIEWQKSPTR
jgi:uncharacterized membrane protein (UPF0127 family)